jgi:hypothetical protein
MKAAHYKYLTEQYPNTVIWIESQNMVRSVGKCKMVTSKVLGIPVQEGKLFGFNKYSLEGNLRKMVLLGHRVAVVTILKNQK